jgi:hypothetical protein
MSQVHLTAEAKHHILLEYQRGVRGRGFRALSSRHGVKGGVHTIQRWMQQWDGTAASLKERERTGRPRVLSSAQVTRHIAAPIRNANRAGRVVRYSRLLPQVRASTGKSLSVQTLRRYGRKELGARQTRGKERTEDECQ